MRIDELHAALSDPILGGLDFLNEVVGRYPEAISFAPGAPHPEHLAPIAIEHYLERFVSHLGAARGIDEARARRLLYEYGPSRGLVNDLIAAALARDFAIEASPASVVVTVGAQEAMLIVLRALFRGPEDVLAVANPSFVGILGAARLLDVPVVGIDEGEDGIDLGALDSACVDARRRGKRIRALYVAPDHSNPSGTCLSLAAREKLLAVADREDLLLLEDNAYAFTADGGGVTGLRALDDVRRRGQGRSSRVIVIGTFAKICLPGARVGYVVADQPIEGAGGPMLLADALATIKSMVTVNTSPIAQALIGGMLLEEGGSFAARSRDRSLRYRANLAHLLVALDRELAPAPDLPPLWWNRPSGGFFVRMRLPIAVDVALLEISASRFGVLWTPMRQFHLGRGGDDELRLSCSYLDAGAIDEGIARLRRFLCFVHAERRHPRARGRALEPIAKGLIP